MRLKRGNVERIVNSPAAVARYKAAGYEEVKKDSATNEKEETAETTKKLEEMTVSELKALAKMRGMEGYSGLAKEDLVSLLKGEE